VIITLKPFTLSVVHGVLEQSNIADSINNFLLFQNAQLLSQLLTKFLHSIMFKISSPAHTHTHTHTHTPTHTHTHHTHTHTHKRSSFNIIIQYVLIQGVPGGKDLTSGECSLGQTIPI